MNEILSNEKGFALIMALLISILSLGLIALAFFIVTSSIMLGGTSKRYTQELDAAKGVSKFVTAEILNENITCNGGGICTPDNDPSICNANAQIDINTAICTVIGKGSGCSGVSACYLSRDIHGITTFHSVQVTSINAVGEKAIIDFVYKVE